MVEDKKNNDTKEELETSKDDKKMDTQQVNENKDSKNIELDSEKENKLTEDNEKEITETETKEKEIQEGQKNEDKDTKNIELDQEKENKLTEDNEKEITETETKEKEMQEGQENEDKVTDIKEEDDPNAKWYVVGAASGFEERAVKTIQDNARKASLSHFFFDFQIPKQEVVEMRRGKKINSEKNFFPGYMLIKMIMNNQTWQLVKNSNKVSGFTGNDHKPIPLSQSEAIKMLKKADDSIEYIAPKYVYEVGQQVKVIDGPFASFNGMVEEVDEERGKLKISVSIFGRSTPVELEYTQVEKI